MYSASAMQRGADQLSLNTLFIGKQPCLHPPIYGYGLPCMGATGVVRRLFARAVKLSSDWCGHDHQAWPPKVGKTVWILDKQQYQRERMSQPRNGKALCLVGALWGLMEQGANRHECGLVHPALCSSPGRCMMGLSMDAHCGGPRIRCRGTPSLCSGVRCVLHGSILISYLVDPASCYSCKQNPVLHC